MAAAAEVFAEVGFRTATVREIVHRAGANVSAVNYYFGDKEGLYAAVLHESLKASYLPGPSSGGVSRRAAPEDRIRDVVLAILRRLLDDRLPSHAGALLTREMVRPTDQIDAVVRLLVEPMYRQLTQVLREIGCGRLQDKPLRLAVHSVVGQCLFYRLCAPLIERLEGKKPLGDQHLRALAGHIVTFSLLGLRGLAHGCTRDKGKRQH
jgi:AcrR family transcriptional regulator